MDYIILNKKYQPTFLFHKEAFQCTLNLRGGFLVSSARSKLNVHITPTNNPQQAKPNKSIYRILLLIDHQNDD